MNACYCVGPPGDCPCSRRERGIWDGRPGPPIPNTLPTQPPLRQSEEEVKRWKKLWEEMKDKRVPDNKTRPLEVGQEIADLRREIRELKELIKSKLG